MQQRRPRLEEKVVIVTGAGSSGPGVGTGKATSILLDAGLLATTPLAMLRHLQ